MYEDSWYSFVPDFAPSQPSLADAQPNSNHRRKESLLQPPDGLGHHPDQVPPSLQHVLEVPEEPSPSPPEPTLIRRPASSSSLYPLSSYPLPAESNHDAYPSPATLPSKPVPASRPKTARRGWEALMLPHDVESKLSLEDRDPLGCLADGPVQEQLLKAGSQEYFLYRDQLALTERHLDGLIADADAALSLLSSLSHSFRAVEAQTSSFQSQCYGHLSDQQQLQKLANEVGTELHYYAYLDTATRRLNGPGASRLVEDADFGDLMDNIDSCIDFMKTHESYRERDSYLARYDALLAKSLHLLHHGFTAKLEKLSSEIGRQIVAAQSESARHALAYGRYEEMLADSDSLLSNLQRVVQRAYDQHGRPVESDGGDRSSYVDSTLYMFRTYLMARDRDLRVMTQRDWDVYQEEVKTLSLETASRNFIKQSFEKVYSEHGIFIRLFRLDPVWSHSPGTAFQALKAVQTFMAHPGNLGPVANRLQSVLQVAELAAVCGVVGWLASAYASAEAEEDEPASWRKYREYAALLLTEHLWPFMDKLFAAEINRSITKAPLREDALEMGPVVDGVASSNAYPLVKRAMELLAMFDQAVPKERSSKNSPVVFAILRETIQALQRAEAKLRSSKTGTDADLFMIKNLLIIKNELISLEIGDIRSQPPSMQHFGQIWETLGQQDWMGLVSNWIGGSLGWGRGRSPGRVGAALTMEDMSEQLDEMLRQSIYAFTKRWGGLLYEAERRKAGAKPMAKVEAELERMLQQAFGNQPEVASKLKEAIALNLESRGEAEAEAGARAKTGGTSKTTGG